MNINDIRYYLEKLGFTYDTEYEQSLTLAIGEVNHTHYKYMFDGYVELSIDNNRL